MILMKTTHPLFFLRAIIWDFEDTALVEVEPTVLALEALLKHPKQHFPAKAENIKDFCKQNFLSKQF